MASKRNTYKYHFKVGNKIVYRGITKDLERREKEHQNSKSGSGHIMQVGNRTTKEAALQWERNGGKAGRR